MKQREFEKWEKYRKLGKMKITLLFALYLIVIVNLANLIVGFIKGDINFYLEGILTRIIVAGPLGAFAGIMTWIGNEREYNKHIKVNKL